jgi:hypothetical protein
MPARHSALHGALHGGKHGLDADMGGGGPVITVPQDGPSSWYMPSTADHFSQLGLPVPLSLWTFQQDAGASSGDMPDSLGTGFTLPDNGSPLYQQGPVTGWSRVLAGFSQLAAQRFGPTSAPAEANPALVSVCDLYFIVCQTVPGATRGIVNQGGNMGVGVTTAGRLILHLAGVTATDSTTGPLSTDDLVHPLLVVHDLTNSVAGMYTDQAATTIAYAAATNGITGIGAGIFSISTPALSGAVLGWRWVGADAELGIDATATAAAAKARLQALNITVTGY